MKKVAWLLILAALLRMLAGCAAEQKEVSEAFKAVVEEFSELYFALDEDGSRFDRELETVGRYLEGELSQEAAMEALEEDLAYYSAELENQEEYKVRSRLADQLEACGISKQDFIAFGNSRSNELYDQKTKTEYLLEYLTTAEEFQDSYDNLAFYHEHYLSLQDCLRGYYYYAGLNAWFAEMGELEVSYVEKTVIGELTCYLPEDPQWCGSQEEAEDLAMDYLDEMEIIITELSEHVGESQEDLYAMERTYTKLSNLIEAMRKEDLSAEPLLSLAIEVQSASDAFTIAMNESDMDAIGELEVQIDGLQAEFDAIMEDMEA